MNLAFKLYRLQQIDSQLDKAKGRLHEIEIILSDDSNIKLADEALEVAKATALASQLEQKKAELDTKAQREKIRDSENQLYGGMVTNPKELQDLQREVEALKRYLSVLEDRQLKTMLESDSSQESLALAKKQRTDAEAEFVERNAALMGEKRILEADMARLDEERIAAASPLTQDEIGRYERLRAKKNGVAVASVSDKTCSACGSTLSAALLQASQTPTGTAECTSCGRILYGG